MAAVADWVDEFRVLEDGDVVELSGINGRRSLGKGGSIIPVIELDQQIPGVHRLVVGDRDGSDQAGDLWRDHGNFAADIGVIGAFDKAPDRPPMVCVPGGADCDANH